MNTSSEPRPTVIRGGRIVDPSQGIDRVSDLFIEDGKIAETGVNVSREGAQVIDASGLVVCPGFIDVHCHLREPGFEYRETIASGTRAAARGGFTTVCAMPNTDPVTDSRSVVDFVLARAARDGVVRVLPIGAVTKGSRGEELAELGELAEAGAIGFSDDGLPVADANLMRQALGYARALGLPIINHCEVHELACGAPMHEGWVSNRLGVKGAPASAESVMVARDISLAELTGGRLHLAHVSTAEAVELVRQAKRRGVDVTCEVTPHHLTLTDETLLGSVDAGKKFDPLSPLAYDTRAKVNPPLRARTDMEAMVEALVDGTIDMIATDHAPHGSVEKLTTLDEAAFGISVLETALGSLMSLVHGGALTLPALIERLTAAPARFLDADLGTLNPGSPADVTIFDPDAEWTVDASRFASKGKNTPLDGTKLRGRVTATLAEGRVVYHHDN